MVARSLLGCVVSRRAGALLSSARIVETEAYLGANDPASHARRGLKSERNKSMYLEGGHAYVYLSYGMHWCLNVVTQAEGTAEAVLIRAGEPVAGIEAMRLRRPRALRDQDLLRGPGRFCMALGIDRSLDGARLDGPELFLSAPTEPVDPSLIAVSPRIGVENSGEAAHWPLRFYFGSSRYVSGYRHAR